jgi:hypothetical protein
MRRFAILMLGFLAAGCKRQEAGEQSIENPAHYRPTTPHDQSGRAIFTGELSLPIPGNVSVTYPQGIDSRLMQISGQGYTLQLDDQGAFMQPATAMIAGFAATLDVRSRGGCMLRVWRVQLSRTSPTNLICSRGDQGHCEQAPAQATIASFCTTDAACRQVDALVAGVHFLPKPWPKVPLPDAEERPEEPVCRP